MCSSDLVVEEKKEEGEKKEEKKEGETKVEEKKEEEKKEEEQPAEAEPEEIRDLPRNAKCFNLPISAFKPAGMSPPPRDEMGGFNRRLAKPAAKQLLMGADFSQWRWHFRGPAL